MIVDRDLMRLAENWVFQVAAMFPLEKFEGLFNAKFFQFISFVDCRSSIDHCCMVQLFSFNDSQVIIDYALWSLSEGLPSKIF